jgi:Protein of unknown function (DUF2867)
MRLASAEHKSRRWRIHEIVPDFTLEDVWGLPVHGRATDFPEFLELASHLSPANANSVATRALWRFRDLLGRWFGIGRITRKSDAVAMSDAKLRIPGTNETSLSDRVPADLKNTAARMSFGSLPFSPLYLTGTEFAAELSNATVHGVMHLGWADNGNGEYQGRMAVYVKPRGWFGRAYMALIKPFRHLIVYPALMKQFESAWNATRTPSQMVR